VMMLEGRPIMVVCKRMTMLTAKECVWTTAKECMCVSDSETIGKSRREGKNIGTLSFLFRQSESILPPPANIPIPKSSAVPNIPLLLHVIYHHPRSSTRSCKSLYLSPTTKTTPRPVVHVCSSLVLSYPSRPSPKAPPIYLAFDLVKSKCPHAGTPGDFPQILPVPVGFNRLVHGPSSSKLFSCLPTCSLQQQLYSNLSLVFMHADTGCLCVSNLSSFLQRWKSLNLCCPAPE
jgi:hypothetical protein